MCALNAADGQGDWGEIPIDLVNDINDAMNRLFKEGDKDTIARIVFKDILELWLDAKYPSKLKQAPKLRMVSEDTQDIVMRSVDGSDDDDSNPEVKKTGGKKKQPIPKKATASKTRTDSSSSFSVGGSHSKTPSNTDEDMEKSTHKEAGEKSPAKDIDPMPQEPPAPKAAYTSIGHVPGVTDLPASGEGSAKEPETVETINAGDGGEEAKPDDGTAMDTDEQKGTEEPEKEPSKSSSEGSQPEKENKGSDDPSETSSKGSKPEDKGTWERPKKKRKPPQQDPWCNLCRAKHPRGKCPKRPQTTPGVSLGLQALGRSISRVTTGSIRAGGHGPSTTILRKQPSAVGSARPKVYEPQSTAERGAITKSISVSGGQVKSTKTVTPSAKNGVAETCYMAGDRSVRLELIKTVGDNQKDRVVFRKTRVYRIVKNSIGFAIGWLDPSLNSELEVDNPPLLIQFGDRTKTFELQFTTGENHEVNSYRWVEGSQRHTHRTALSELMDRDGKLVTGAVAGPSKRVQEAPGRLHEAYGLAGETAITKDPNGLDIWTMQIFSLYSSRPTEIRNEYISYLLREPPRVDEPIRLNGTIVDANNPKWTFGGCSFPLQVDQRAAPVQHGVYFTKVSATGYNNFVNNYNPIWTGQVDNFADFRNKHQMAVHMFGAVAARELDIVRQRASNIRFALSEPTQLEKFVYHFKVKLDNVAMRHVRDINNVRNVVRIFTTHVGEDGKTIEKDVMIGLVSKTTFKKGLLHTVSVKHFIRQSRVEEKRVGAIEDSTKVTTLVNNSKGLEELTDMFDELKLARDYKEKFFETHLKGKTTLHMEQIPSLAGDRAMLKHLLLLLRSTGSDAYRHGRLMATMNGMYIVPKTTNWLHLANTAAQANMRDYFMLNLSIGKEIDKLTEMDNEQRQAIRLAVADDPPIMLVQANAGTGKTTFLAGACSGEIFRARKQGRTDMCKILVAVPLNKAACSAANRLSELLLEGSLKEDEVLLVQSTYELMESVEKSAAKFTMFDHAKRLLRKKSLPPAETRVLETFLEISKGGIQVDYDVRSVLAVIIHRAKPLIIVCTLGMAHLHFVLRQGVTVVMIDEGGRCRDDSVRALVASIPSVNKVIVAGDIRQLGPYNEPLVPPQFIRFGRDSFLEIAMNRGLAPVSRLTVNRRAISSLVRPLTHMNADYATMTSGVDDPDMDTDDYVRLPPLVTKECTIVLMHVPSAHHKTKSGSIANPIQEKVAAKLAHLLVDYNHLLDGDEKLDCVLECNYLASSGAIEPMVRDIDFSDRGGVYTVDGAQSGEADIVIYVMGRTRTSTEAGKSYDFSRDPKRIVTATTRAAVKFFVIADFNFATMDINSELFKYLTAVATETPVIDGVEYIKMLQEHIRVGKEQKAAEDQNLLSYYRYGGHGVLKKHLVTGTHEEDFSHIPTDVRLNINNGWADKRLYVPPEHIEKGYEPPAEVAYDDPLEDLPDPRDLAFN
jgi:hypothetical protein